MSRLLFLLGIAAAVFYIYALVDCAMADENRVRGVPKAAWIVIIVLLPVAGAVLWFAVGRGGRHEPEKVSRSVAPDDDAGFLDQLGWKRDQEERIRRLEQELSKLDNPDTDPPKRPDA